LIQKNVGSIPVGAALQETADVMRGELYVAKYGNKQSFSPKRT